MTIGGVFAWIGARHREHLIESEHQSQHIASDFQGMKRLEEVGTLCGSAESEFSKCLDEILDAAIALTSADKGNIQLLDPQSGAFRIMAGRGLMSRF